MNCGMISQRITEIAANVENKLDNLPVVSGVIWKCEAEKHRDCLSRPVFKLRRRICVRRLTMKIVQGLIEVKQHWTYAATTSAKASKFKISVQWVESIRRLV